MADPLNSHQSVKRTRQGVPSVFFSYSTNDFWLPGVLGYGVKHWSVLIAVD